MAAINSNVKSITSNKLPTAETLPKGSIAFGFVGSDFRAYGNSDGVVREITAKNYADFQKPIGTWINGATLYQKVIYCGQLPQVETQAQPAYKEISTELAPNAKIVRVEGFAYKNGSVEFPLPFTSGDDNVTFGSRFNLSKFSLRSVSTKARTFIMYTFPGGSPEKIELGSNNQYYNDHTAVLILDYVLT